MDWSHKVEVELNFNTKVKETKYRGESMVPHKSRVLLLKVTATCCFLFTLNTQQCNANKIETKSKVYKDSCALTSTSAIESHPYRQTQLEAAAVPDVYVTTPLDCCGGTFRSSHEMDSFLDSTWSRYEIDCALQSQEFYSAYKEETMSKSGKAIRSLGKMEGSEASSSPPLACEPNGVPIIIKEEKIEEEFVSPRPIHGRRRFEAAQRVPSINCKTLQKVPSMSDLSETDRYNHSLASLKEAVNF
ncbi:unnamed protein product [Orchesella dallaii]|uniref:Uncharacterized protein n=1 Tax=Orchesella dallaii TaxID=48710 RepID=A0ABP1QX40_9HEXA